MNKDFNMQLQYRGNITNNNHQYRGNITNSSNNSLHLQSGIQNPHLRMSSCVCVLVWIPTPATVRMPETWDLSSAGYGLIGTIGTTKTPLGGLGGGQVEEPTRNGVGGSRNGSGDKGELMSSW